MPTKTTEVLRLQDQGSKMFLDSVLTTHERVVQVSTLEETRNVSASPASSLCPLFLLLPCLSRPVACDDILQVSVLDRSLSPYVIPSLYAFSFIPLASVTIIIY